MTKLLSEKKIHSFSLFFSLLACVQQFSTSIKRNETSERRKEWENRDFSSSDSTRQRTGEKWVSMQNETYATHGFDIFLWCNSYSHRFWFYSLIFSHETSQFLSSLSSHEELRINVERHKIYVANSRSFAIYSLDLNVNWMQSKWNSILKYELSQISRTSPIY